MAVLTKKFSLVFYIGTSPLTLSNLSSGVKTAIKRITQPNAGGTAYASFNPASGVNSLTTAAAATSSLVQQFIVETVSASPSVDLGASWAFAPPNVAKLVFTIPANGTNYYTDAVTILSADAGTYTIESLVGVTIDNYLRNSTTIVAPGVGATVALAAGDTLRFTASTGSTAGVITLTKQ